jgi:acyl-CoA thioester hydrolase
MEILLYALLVRWEYVRSGGGCVRATLRAVTTHTASASLDSNPEHFELRIQIQPADIDELGHVNNVVYVRWVQDIATAHWRAAAPVADQEKVVWVVVRHEIDYKRAAVAEDEILARTWVGPATRLTFERNTELLRASDRQLLARARTLWCPIDVITGKPTEVSPEVRAGFSVGVSSPRG